MSTKLLVVVENLDTMLDTLEDKLKSENEYKDNNLDSMLVTLEERLNKDGVATTYKGICASCEKPIHNKVCHALGKSFHPDHFVCSVCQVELYNKTFYEREGRAYCEKDYQNQYAPKCFACGEPVIFLCVTSDSRTWHPEHFVCVECGKQLNEESGFHEECGISLEGRNFFEKDGKQYCETHYRARRSSVCKACNQPILHQCMTALGEKYHPEHFTCSFCKQELNHGTFKEKNGKAYCKRCYLKTFGRH
ncbi:paxillin-like isoform X2 [Hydractinia symbiolongicarpus]|uniref:paxillin-like isoform X2 n=1 Tax=Hydractinia symbiolongicarpus TaxID=13093 RepID=UPI0025516EC0|nr:paxillin-like isoform X2 [Hydractinia symbiolongicarpus]XP_057309186.1 paxillin-like isoform X2 [Hydractinia symbiolongicarpus]